MSDFHGSLALLAAILFLWLAWVWAAYTTIMMGRALSYPTTYECLNNAQSRMAIAGCPGDPTAQDPGDRRAWVPHSVT
jgi:hypothetical protein